MGHSRNKKLIKISILFIFTNIAQKFALVKYTFCNWSLTLKTLKD